MVIVTTDTEAKIFSTKSLSRHKQPVTILTSLARESMPQSYDRVSEVNLHSRETERLDLPATIAYAICRCHVH